MQIFKKNSMPSLTMFKKVSRPKHLGKKMMMKSSMNASAMPEKDSDDKKYHLERKM